MDTGVSLVRQILELHRCLLKDEFHATVDGLKDELKDFMAMMMATHMGTTVMVNNQMAQKAVEKVDVLLDGNPTEKDIATAVKTEFDKVGESIETLADPRGARTVVLPPREEQQEQEFAEVSGVTITEIIAGADVKAKGIRMSGGIGMFVDTGRPPGRLLGG